MINLDPESATDLRILRAFAENQWREGLLMLAEREKAKYVNVTMRSGPDDPDSERGKAAYAIYDADPESIIKCVDQFMAEEATAKRGS